jgi:anti-sigma factor RsiW
MMPRKRQADAIGLECEEVLDLLHAFVANELEEDDIRPVLEHLGDCESCRAAMAEHVKILGVLRANMPSLVKPYFTKYDGSLN